jgi:methionine aminotransferase
LTSLRSKLPDVGTTIFTVISRRADELGAVNLGQGFPDYPIDPRLTELVTAAMEAGFNQYAPMPGLPALQQRIAEDLRQRQGLDVDPASQITITVGATEAIFSAVLALAAPGDEVMVFDPAYDSYDPAVRLAGAQCVHVPLLPPAFGFDWDRIRAAVTPRTRMLIVNSPQNPCCTVMSRADLRQLAALAEQHDLLVLSDEVYEHLVFDGATHCSVLSEPALRQRSLAVFSFGKSLHATGLRVGYCVAPPELTVELRRVHQFNTFTIATALQQAVAGYLGEKPGVYAGLARFFAAKRDLLARGLAGSPLRVLPSAGTYFTLVDYSASDLLGAHEDGEAARVLLEEVGVAAIPLTPFYRQPVKHRLLRLCFAKQDATLQRALERLRALR